jgi:hypothetical protein
VRFRYSLNKNLLTLAVKFGCENCDPSRVAAWFGQRLHKSFSDHVIGQREDWNLGGCSLSRFNSGITTRHDYIDASADEFRCVTVELRAAQSKPSIVDCQVFPFDEACTPEFGSKSQVMRRIARS